MGTRATEARGGVDAGTYLGLEAGLVGETLETDLVEGIGGVTARSRRSGTTVSGWFGSCDRGVSAPALRCRRFPPKKSKRRRGDAGGCSPDELAKEDLLVGVEGLLEGRAGEQVNGAGQSSSSTSDYFFFPSHSLTVGTHELTRP